MEPTRRNTIDDAHVSNPGWNEAHFVDRASFARMAPPILQLEIRRAGRILAGHEPGTGLYNDIITVRHELVRARTHVLEFGERCDPAEVLEHVERAAAFAAVLAENDPADITEPGEDSLRYIADRLLYIHGQIRHLY
ncbi:MAG: hypothetical protein HKN17_00570 [Rhodothermales bacterium]|nr:hypothetical protein [Rhodothermales bacterium]